MKKLNTLEQRNEDKATADNLNQKSKEEAKALANHIKGKYASKMIPTLVDRLDLYAAGYGCDFQMTGLLRQAGITL